MKRQTGIRLSKTDLITTLVICGMLFTAISSRAQDPQKVTSREILEMSLEELMEMDISSASKVKQKIREAPATVRVITADQIRTRGYTTLEQALADLPGFQFRNINGFNTYSFLRGLPSQNNLILLLIDGIQVNELNSGGFYGGGQYDLADAERIEVVYGPSSALYGTNAVSGIINIITKKPEKPNSGHIGAALGNFRTTEIDFGYDYLNRNGDVNFRIAGMFSSSEKADLRGSRGDNNWTDNMENYEDNYSLSGYFRYKNLFAGVSSRYIKSSRTTNYTTVNNKYLDRGSHWNILFTNIYAGYQFAGKDKWSNTVRIYARNSTVLDNTVAYILKSDTASRGDQVGYYRPNWLAGVDNVLEYNPFKNLQFIGGVTLEQEEVADGFAISHSDDQDITPPAPGRPSMISDQLFSIYLQGQFSFLRYFILTAGARQDFSSYYDKALTPRVALMFNLNNFSARIAWMEAFRAPRPWDYTAGTGNPGLKPEQMRSGEVSLSYSPFPSLSLETSVYHNKLSRMLITEFTDTLGNFRWNNHDEATVTGIEASAVVKTGRIDLAIHYTYNDAHDRQNNILPEISPHVAGARLNLKLIAGLGVNLGGYFYDRKKSLKTIKATGSQWIDEAFVLNGSIHYLGWNGFDFQLMINNILNTEYYHPSNLLPDRYRQPQRSVLVKITKRFDFGRKEKH